MKKGLVERPIQSLNGLGNARITAHGIDVVQGKTSPPLSILLHARITAQDVQVGEDNIQNVTDTKLNVLINHSEASPDMMTKSGLLTVFSSCTLLFGMQLLLTVADYRSVACARKRIIRSNLLAT